MSMYQIMFGRNRDAILILALLALTIEGTGRFRDAFVADGEIAIYTRNGGGNRDDQEQAIEQMRSHPNYLRDEDDSFDSTYATFYFSFPEQYAHVLKEMESGKFNPDERWQAKLQEIESMSAETLQAKFPAITEVVRRIFEK